MPNLALISIPAYYILTLAPHVYAVSVVSKHAEWNNVNPRSPDYIKTLQQKLPSGTFAQFERAESAHRNSVENLPLFIAAVGAGLLAEKVTSSDVGTASYAGLFLASRAVYSLLYINTESQKYSALRSWTFLVSVGLSFWQIYKSAVALA